MVHPDSSRSPLLFPMAPAGLDEATLVVSRGRNALLVDTEGKAYLDAPAGLWCVNLGYGHPLLAGVAADMFRTLPFAASFGGVATDYALNLSSELIRKGHLAGLGTLRRVFFGVSGSEANETALKFASMHHQQRGDEGRDLVLSLDGGFHGLTGSATHLTGIETYRRGLNSDTRVVRLPLPVRLHDADEAVDAVIADTRAVLADVDLRRVSAFIAEPVQGVGGVVRPPPRYWRELVALLRAAGVVIIADEVITGIGRTGHWFASRDMAPDIVTVSKGLTSGYFPMSATLVSEGIEHSLKSRPDALMHGFTCSGHPVGAALALETMAIIERDNLLERVAQRGLEVQQALGDLAAQHPMVAGVRHGGGFMHALVMSGADQARSLALAARQVGLIVRPLPYRGVVALSPPFTASDEDLQMIVQRLDMALTDLERQG